MDGEVYNLGGIETIVIGGAYSIDKFYRLAYGYGWWPDEQPSPAIKEKVERVLDARAWKVDAVLSHTTPQKYEPVEVFLSGVDQSKVDKSTEEYFVVCTDEENDIYLVKGQYKTITGIVLKVDQHEQRITIRSGADTEVIPFSDIYRIFNPTGSA